MFSKSDLFELLAGEGLELRRVGDLVLSLVLELFPLVLQVSRDSTTEGENKWGERLMGNKRKEN